MKLLLDTCAVLWAVHAPERLSPLAVAALNDRSAQVFVSAISLGEIACLCERGRLELDRHWKLWFRYYLEQNGWECLPIGLEVIEDAYSLQPPFHDDPADRILTATARVHSCHLVTADSKILRYPHVRTLW